MHSGKTLLLFLLLVVVGAGSIQAQSVTARGGPTAAAGEGFGGTVALEAGYALVSESFSGISPGSVYVYAPDAATGGWTEQAVLTAADGAAGDGFGQAIALSDDEALIGAPGAAGEVGRVYVFRREAGDAWIQQHILTSDDATPGGRFGQALAFDGDRALIGAYNEDDGTGAAYVFERDAATGAWAQQARLVGSDIVAGELFGWAVSLQGDEAFVSAQYQSARVGAVYVFQRGTDGRWTEQQKLVASDATPGARFGRSIAFSGAFGFVGTPFEEDGVVYVFQRGTDGRWTEQQKLSGGDADGRRDWFGWAVALRGDGAMVGAPFGNDGTGAAYVFRRQPGGDTWTQEALLAESQADGDEFGWAVALFDDDALVGVRGEDFGAGAAYAFRQTEGTWTPLARLVGADASFTSILGGRMTCTAGAAAAFPCREVDLLAFLAVQDLGGRRGIGVNDLWGWTDPQTGKEYALVGREDGVAFVDVSDPINPSYRGALPLHAGAQVSVWRDLKVYADHVFVVADFAGPHGMQVFDLTELRAVTDPPVTFAETAHYAALERAHNIAINEETGFAYAVGSETCGGGLHMIDVRIPTSPTFAGCFSSPSAGGGYTHDAQCVVYRGPDAEHQGREICVGSNVDGVSVADVTDKANPVELAAGFYPNAGYVHQGWLTEDHRYFLQDDELDERSVPGISRTRTIVWDFSDLDAPQVLTEYFAETPSIDHNLYVSGPYVYQSNYTAGLRILDIRDIRHPVEVAFFDTVPGTDAPGFEGSWSNYPFFKSGIVIVTSREAGLFIVDPTGILVATEADETPGGFALSAAYPNPFNPQTTLTLRLPAPERVTVAAYDVLGRRVALLYEGLLAGGAHRLVLEASGLPGGVYLVRARGERAAQTRLVTLVK